MNIHDFIEEFRSVIVASVGRDSNPLYHPGTDRKAIYKLIKRTPQTAHRKPDRRYRRYRPGSPIARFRNSRGRDGSRQNLYLHCCGGRSRIEKALVVCPPHLVSKWRREVKQTVPTATAVAAERIGHLEKALRENEPPLFVILSREKGKTRLLLERTRDARQRRHPCLP